MRSRFMTGRLLSLFLVLATAGFLAGCGDMATRHKVLNILFDGVPEMPPAVEYCDDYCTGMIEAQEQEDVEVSEEDIVAGTAGSGHRPYIEKDCSGCHDFDTESGLIKPPRELCQVCHTNFIQDDYVHGPVAVGDCLACHLPHRSKYPALLKEPQETLCQSCHVEPRLAEAMHNRLADRQMACDECHNPHFGGSSYFLK